MLTELFSAIVNDDIATIETILTNNPALINVQDATGITALHLAAIEDKPALIDYLISVGSDPTLCDNDGRSILHYAAGGSLDCVDKVLQQSAASNSTIETWINKPDHEGNTPLHEAAAEGNIEMIVYLISLGANMFAKNNISYGAIDHAIDHDQLETVKFLYEQGQKPNENKNYLCGLHLIADLGHTKILNYFIEKGLNLFVLNKYKCTPLHTAAYKGNTDCLYWILNHPNATYIDDQGSSKRILTKQEFVNLRTTTGNTALHLAAKCGHVAAINLLIRQGAEIESKNNNGETPLDLAIAGNHKKAADFIINHQLNHKPDTKQENIKIPLTTNDPFSILGLAKDASAENIRKAYVHFMREYHPDKVSKNGAADQNIANENAKKVNWAYKILTDEEERKKWEASQAETEANIDSHPPVSTTAERLSESYKRSFENLEKFFQISPLTHLAKENKHQAFYELHDLTHNKLFGEERYQHLYRIKDSEIEFSDVYHYIEHLEKESIQLPPLNVNLKENITTQIAVNLLLQFLAGKFYGKHLTAIQDYLRTEISKLNPKDHPDFVFYQSIQTIIHITAVEKEYQKALDALQVIYSFTYQPKIVNDDIIQLMQDKYFRYFVADAHRYYWQDDTPVINATFLAKMKSELASLYVLPWGKTLLRIEEQMLSAFSDKGSLDSIYDCAYLLIDLSNSYLTYATVINSTILAGLCFQYAAREEKSPSKAMAAEHIALCLYQKAMRYVFQAGPQVALYASTHIAKYASELVYDQSTLDRKAQSELIIQPGDASIAIQEGSAVKTIKGAIQKALYLIDMFPFYTGQKSTFDLEVIGMFQLSLTRSLLQSLLNQKPLSSNQDYTKIIYELYQDAIEKWCENQAEQEMRWEEEIKFKLLAIELLLEKDHSHCEEMERLIDQPYIHMQRDVEGFLQINGVLHFPNEDNIKVYKSFDGFEINNTTGAINLLLSEWQEGDSPSLRLFTAHDLVQMITLGVTGGALSLDHLDPHKKYHPLQMVRYAPNYLQDTEYLKTLFMTDYLLKMFATGVEISADTPYLVRRIDKLLASLPEHLRKVLTLSYEENSRKINNHRFWITTEDIERQQITTDQLTTVHYGAVNISIKTHPLDFNAEGELVDAQIDPEDKSPESIFAKNLTTYYREIGTYFPEFLRLEQLVKIAGAIAELKQFREQNKLAMKNNAELLEVFKNIPSSKSEFNKALDKQHAIENEFKEMRLSDEPEKNTALTETTLRAPSIFHEYKDGTTEHLHHIYGGVIAYPKFTDKVLGQSPTAQDQVVRRAKELILNDKKNTTSQPSNKTTNKPDASLPPNPCSTSAFINAALKRGYEEMDIRGWIPHDVPSVNPAAARAHFDKAASHFTGGRGSEEEYAGLVKMTTYLTALGIGLFEQWKVCKESKKQQADFAPLPRKMN